MELESFHLAKEQFEQFKILLEDWMPKDASIAIALENTYVYFATNAHHIQLEIGEKVHPDSIASLVLKNKQKTDAIVNESIFGKPYYVIGYPIYVNNYEAALILILPPSYSPEKKEPYRFLTGKQDEDWTPIPIEQISHIESLQKKTWFYVDYEQYKTNITLKELQTKLPGYFVRIHRSYIINIYFIERIRRDLTSNLIIKLKDGTELPVSQSYVNDLRKVLEF